MGGPALGANNGPDGPIGELDSANGYDQLPTFIAYYRSARAAQQFEPTAVRSAKRLGEVVKRRGEVIVLWPRRPTSEQRGSVETCAFPR